MADAWLAKHGNKIPLTERVKARREKVKEFKKEIESGLNKPKPKKDSVKKIAKSGPVDRDIKPEKSGHKDVDDHENRRIRKLRRGLKEGGFADISDKKEGGSKSSRAAKSPRSTSGEKNIIPVKVGGKTVEISGERLSKARKLAESAVDGSHP